MDMGVFLIGLYKAYLSSVITSSLGVNMEIGLFSTGDGKLSLLFGSKDSQQSLLAFSRLSKVKRSILSLLSMRWFNSTWSWLVSSLRELSWLTTLFNFLLSFSILYFLAYCLLILRFVSELQERLQSSTVLARLIINKYSDSNITEDWSLSCSCCWNLFCTFLAAVCGCGGWCTFASGLSLWALQTYCWSMCWRSSVFSAWLSFWLEWPWKPSFPGHFGRTRFAWSDANSNPWPGSAQCFRLLWFQPGF